MTVEKNATKPRRLAIVHPAAPDVTHSPEFSYLHSFCRLQAQRVFEDVSFVAFAAVGGNAEKISRADAVLLLCSPWVAFTAVTLGAMWQRLQEGCTAVFPYLLATAGLTQERPIYTLHGFEQLEAFVLSTNRPLNVAPSHRPMALFAPDMFLDMLSRHPIDWLATTPSLPTEEHSRLRTAHAGLCHEFIDYYGEVRTDLEPFMPRMAQDVLEIGCAKGATGKYLQERLGVRVTGVELNPVVAKEAAKTLYRVICGDFLTAAIDGTYDVIVATELFEHLPDPFAFFAKCRSLLRPGGRIVLSVPNVGHYSVVQDLLAGRWDYLPIGLLCWTHVRFFTAATLRDWLEAAGFRRFELVPQTGEVPQEFRQIRSQFEIDEASLSTRGFYVLIDV